MKYIKRIDELKSDTYRQAGEKLLRYGHPSRGQKLTSYGSSIRAEEIKKEIADAEVNLESDIIRLENELKNKALCSNPFKLKIKLPETEKLTTGYNFSIDSSINSNTNFYLTDFQSPQLWDSIQEYISVDWFGIEILPCFSFVDVVEKELEPNPIWPNEKRIRVKVAKVREIEPFKVGISLKSEICAYDDNFTNLGYGPKEIENQLYQNAYPFMAEAYNDFLGRDSKYPLTNRHDARLLLNEIKKTFSDDGKVFKAAYKMFKEQEEFDYHAVLSALQRAVMDKISLNLLYSE